VDPVALLKSKTAAVVTTFAPDESLEANLRCISIQVPLVILVDDTGGGGPMPPEPAIANLVVLRHPCNLGIGAALNSGITEAARRGFEWVVTLDDDTRVRPDYLDLAFAFVRRNAVPKLGLVALSRPGSGTLGAPDTDGYSVRRNIITSGSVFPIAVFHALGGFSADLFIDLVDFDFCCRARQHGWSLVQLAAAGMEHRVGNSEKRRCLGVSVTVYHHAPFRLYYQARNAIVFARRHFGFDPLLCLYLLVELVRLPARASCFERDKRSRLRHIVAGIRDALRGRLGRMP